MKNISFLLFLISTFSALSQNVVVSEYLNVNGVPDGEWLELLITQDNTTLVGYKLRDNSDAGVWREVIEFANHPLWKNMRSGTIIVINSRGGVKYDVDRNDGFLEVSLDDPDLFIAPASGWSGNMDINSTNDIIQILNPSLQNVHTLGHMSSGSPVYNSFISINGAKLSRNGTVGSNGSVKVVPGNNLSNYIAGFEPNNDNTAESQQSTKGKPNKSTSSIDDNQKLWRQLRQPTWTSPSLNLNYANNNISLNWSSAQTDIDNTQGYIFVSYPNTDSPTNADLPVDGKIYSIGSQIGNGKVIAQLNSNVLNYSFNTTGILDCGVNYTFRVFAYRYKQDDNAQDTDEKQGRGRSYNETEFAATTYELPKAEIATISSTNGNKICKGQTSVLIANTSSTITKFQWYYNDITQPIVGEVNKTLTITKGGRYLVKLISNSGCDGVSQSFVVDEINFPVARLQTKSFQFSKDTVIKFCSITGYELICNDGENRTWYLNNVELSKNNLSQIINQSGIVKVVTMNGNSCTTSSINITFIEDNPNYNVSKSKIDFGIVDSYSEETFDVTNIETYPFNIRKIELPSGFTLVSPKLPIKLLPGVPEKFTIRFSPSKSGSISDSIRLIGGCFSLRKIDVSATKAASDLEVNTSQLTFKDITFCNNKSSNTISLKNNGNKNIVINALNVLPPFNIIDPISTFNIAPQQSQLVVIEFNPLNYGDYNQTLKIPYTSNSTKWDTLLVELDGSKINDKLSLLPNEIIFNNANECTNFFDTLLVVKNNGTKRINTLLVDLKNNKNVEIINNLSRNYLDAGEEDIIKIRLYPDNQLPIKINIDLIGELDNCSQTFTSLVSMLPKLYYNVKPLVDTLNYGNVYDCNYSQKNITTKLNISGNISQKIKLEKISLPDGVECSIKTGDMFDNTDKPDISFILNKTLLSDFVNEKVSLTFSPCEIVTELFLNAKKAQFTLNYKSNPTDFGTVGVSTPTIRTLTVNNSTEDDLILSNVDGLMLPFTLSDATKNKLPITIQKNKSSVLEFVYSQDKLDSKDTILVDLYFTNPCNNVKEVIKLVGATDKTIKKLMVGVGNEKGDTVLNSKPGKYISIPIYFTTDNSDTISNYNILEVDFNLSFNKNILMPESFSINPTLQANISNAVYTYDSTLGNANLKFKVSKSKSIESGNWFNLNCLTFLGDSISTSLVIGNNLLPNNQNVQVIKLNGKYESEGVCVIKLRFVEFVSLLDLKVTSNINSPLVTFNTLSKDEEIRINIYNINGDLVYNQIISKPTLAQYQIPVDQLNLSSGYYLVKVETGNLIETQKLIYNK